MTAEVCVGEAESKRATACGAEPNGGVPVGAEGRLKGGFKARGREETNPTARTLEIVRGKLAGQIPIPRVGVLMTLREDPKDIAEQIRRELDTQFAASDALRTPESDGDGRREDGAEDHYEEGDAAAACAKPAAPQASKEPVEATMPRVQERGGWESFLLQRNLRVLLVEDDDSTRHVVGALLRNCNYEGRYHVSASTPRLASLFPSPVIVLFVAYSRRLVDSLVEHSLLDVVERRS